LEALASGDVEKAVVDAKDYSSLTFRDLKEGARHLRKCHAPEREKNETITIGNF
jgi:hypothetical protein